MDWQTHLKWIQRATGNQQSDIAEKLGYTRQKFNNRYQRDAIRTYEWYQILDALGVEVKYYYNGVEIKPNAEDKVSGMSNYTVYDTAKAQEMASVTCDDEIVAKLFLDNQDRYFIVEFSPDGYKPKIYAEPYEEEQAEGGKIKRYELYSDLVEVFFGDNGECTIKQI